MRLVACTVGLSLFTLPAHALTQQDLCKIINERAQLTSVDRQIATETNPIKRMDLQKQRDNQRTALTHQFERLFPQKTQLGQYKYLDIVNFKGTVTKFETSGNSYFLRVKLDCNAYLLISFNTPFRSDSGLGRWKSQLSELKVKDVVIVSGELSYDPGAEGRFEYFDSPVSLGLKLTDMRKQ